MTSIPFPVKTRQSSLAGRLYRMHPGKLETDSSMIAYRIVHGRTTTLPKFDFHFELIAIPFNEEQIRENPEHLASKFYGLVNGSSSPLLTYFEGEYSWLKKGSERYATDIVSCLRQHGFIFDSSSWNRNSRTKLPCVIMGNLISDRVDYTEKSKAKMDTAPFTETIRKAVSSIAPKIKTFAYYDITFVSERSYSSGRSFGLREKKRTIKSVVREMLMPRIRTVQSGGKITTEETQDEIWYLALPLFEKYNVKFVQKSRKSFKSYIVQLCREEDVSREAIGIIASPWASLFFNGEWYDVSYHTIKKLAEMGTDLIFIEKRGVVQKLGRHASTVGVALVNTHGQLSEYTKELSELAEMSGANIAIFTDYDIYGLQIASKLKGVIWLGVDEKMLQHFNIPHENVGDRMLVVPSNPKKKLLKSTISGILSDERFSNSVVDAEFLEHSKVEIDAILKDQGSEKLWNYLMNKLLTEYPKRNYLRVIDSNPSLESHYPKIIRQVQAFIDKRVEEITEEEAKEIEQELEEYEGFLNVKDKEKEIDERLGKMVEDDPEIQAIAVALERLDKDKDLGISETEEEEEKEAKPKPTSSTTTIEAEEVKEEEQEATDVIGDDVPAPDDEDEVGGS